MKNLDKRNKIDFLKTINTVVNLTTNTNVDKINTERSEEE
jgi:hypothetical protein